MILTRRPFVLVVWVAEAGAQNFAFGMQHKDWGSKKEPKGFGDFDEGGLGCRLGCDIGRGHEREAGNVPAPVLGDGQ